MKITKIYHPEKVKKAKQDVFHVAAYCRVSTKLEDQKNSFEAQQTVYTEMINAHEGWELVDIYADRGISGTSARKRPQFLRMIEDCERGLIDIILCKSISRFARNAKETIFYVRRLQEFGVRLIFEKEEIDTENSYSEMMLTILAAFSEEESRSMSENIKWAIRAKAKSGEVPLPRLYGYRKNGDNYEVVPEEAEIVRMIFDMYEHGATKGTIINRLSDMNIPTSTGNDRWGPTIIHNMILNEKYAGDCRTQRTFHKDITDGRVYKNNGELPFVYIKNHHEPIVPREQFERCGRIMELKNLDKGQKYPFGDYLHCPYCGHVLSFRSDYQHKSLFICEGAEEEMACGKFVIDMNYVESAVLMAYNTIDLNSVKLLTGLSEPHIAEEAEKMLKTKAEYPVFDKVDFWWLDDLVREIRFGQHTFTEAGGKQSYGIDDRTISVFWKCGLSATVPSGIRRKDPRRRAEEIISRGAGSPTME